MSRGATPGLPEPDAPYWSPSWAASSAGMRETGIRAAFDGLLLAEVRLSANDAVLVYRRGPPTVARSHPRGLPLEKRGGRLARLESVAAASKANVRGMMSLRRSTAEVKLGPTAARRHDTTGRPLRLRSGGRLHPDVPAHARRAGGLGEVAHSRGLGQPDTGRRQALRNRHRGGAGAALRAPHRRAPERGRHGRARAPHRDLPQPRRRPAPLLRVDRLRSTLRGRQARALRLPPGQVPHAVRERMLDDPLAAQPAGASRST